MINIEEIVRQEVERQDSLLNLISHLDTKSKRMVLDRSEDQVKGLSFAVSELSKGLIEQRHQIGAVAALSATSLFVNERKSKQKNR